MLEPISFSPKLSKVEISLITEETEILNSIKTTIESEQLEFKTDLQAIKQRFMDARDATVGAEETDLPSLYEQMNTELSLANRIKPKPLPSSGSPYFARMTLTEKTNKEDRHRTVLLGYTSLISSKSDFPIVDWRNAPLAKIFFECRPGDEFEQELPSRIIEGTMTKRHIVTIQDGSLVRIQTSDKIIELIDGTWECNTKVLDNLSGGQGESIQNSTNFSSFGNGSTKRKRADISALLDPDQYEILQKDSLVPLLVTGGAGSGKTTVALHRIAAINFQDPVKFHPSRCGIIVPEVGLSKLIENLLRLMKIDGAFVSTYDNWLSSAGRSIFKSLPKNICEVTPPPIVTFKRHPALRNAIDAFYLKKTAENPNWNPLDDINETRFELFSDKTILAKAVDSSNAVFRPEILTTIISHCCSQHQLTLREEIGDVEADSTMTSDGMSLEESNPDDLSGTIDLEDIPALFYLLSLTKTGKMIKHRQKFNHLLLDEAQEIAPLELAILGKSLEGNSATISGDDSQLTDTTSTFRGWSNTVKDLGLKNYESQTLETNYRCTKPISEIASTILGPLAKNLPESKKHGKPVIISNYKQFSFAIIDIIDKLSDLMSNEPRCSVAIVARNEENCRKFYEYLKSDLDLRIVLDGDFSFKPGIDITTVSNVKGLEFDYVLIPDADRSTYPTHDYSRKDLYVGVTRAIHQLWLVSSSTPSMIIDDSKSPCR